MFVLCKKLCHLFFPMESGVLRQQDGILKYMYRYVLQKNVNMFNPCVSHTQATRNVPVIINQ